MRHAVVDHSSLKTLPQRQTLKKYAPNEVPDFGDLHANVLYAICQLYAAGLITIDPSAYDRLQQIYFKEGPFTPEEVKEFSDLMWTHIDFEYHDKCISFIGDVIGDRGHGKWMLDFFELIKASGNQAIIHLSNHDFTLYDYFFSEEILAALEAEVKKQAMNMGRNPDETWQQYCVDSQEYGKSPGKWHQLLGSEQARSLYELIAMIESDDYPDVTFESCKAVVKSAVLPGLHAFTTVYNKEEKEINVKAHASVGPETIASAAEAVGIAYQADTPGQYVNTIVDVDKAWRELCVENPIFFTPQELVKLYLDGSAVTDKSTDLNLPFIRASHNRADQANSDGIRDDIDIQKKSTPLMHAEKPRGREGIKQREAAKTEWEGVVLRWVHGHEGGLFTQADKELFGSIKDKKEKDVAINEAIRQHSLLSHLEGNINLDSSSLGREGSMHRGRPFHAEALTHFMYFVTNAGETAIPAPQELQGIRRVLRKENHRDVKEQMLPSLLNKLMAALETLQKSKMSLQDKDSLGKMSGKIIQIMGSSLSNFHPGSLELVEQKINADVLEQVSRAIISGCDAIRRLNGGQYRETLTSFKQYLDIKQMIDDIAEQPKSKQSNYMRQKIDAIFVPLCSIEQASAEAVATAIQGGVSAAVAAGLFSEEVAAGAAPVEAANAASQSLQAT